MREAELPSRSRSLWPVVGIFAGAILCHGWLEHRSMTLYQHDGRPKRLVLGTNRDVKQKESNCRVSSSCE